MSSHRPAIPATGRDPVPEASGAILDALPDGILLSTLDGTIRAVNARLEEMSGFTRSELVGKPIEVLVPARSRESHEMQRLQYYSLGLPGRPMGTGVELTLRRKDGTELPVDIALSVFDALGDSLVVSAIRDATERKRADATIRENERRWRSLLEEVRLIVIGLDGQAKIVYANPHVLALTGYSAEEILGRDWFDIFVPGQAAEAGRQAFAQLLEEGLHPYQEGPVVTKAGEGRVVAWYNTRLRDPDGSVIGTLSIGEDVTERRRAEERLAAASEVAQAILAGGEADQALALIARRARQLVGAAIAIVVAPEPGGESLVVRAADGENADELREARIAPEGLPAGEVVSEPVILRDISTHATATRAAFANFGPALLVPLARDRAFGTLGLGNRRGGREFTEHDLAVVQLFASQAAVALEYARVQTELQRLTVMQDRERIGRELHDGVIQALFATALRLQGALAMPAGEEVTRRIEQAVTEIDDVIRDLRNYIFGLRPGVLARAEIEEALRTLARELEERAGVTTVVEVDPGAAAALQDSAADVVQLAREALSNVARHARATTCRVTLSPEDGHAILVIDDDGRGFDPVRAFGRGQGLPNLRDRAAALGAELEVSSEPGRGTTVRAAIPID